MKKTALVLAAVMATGMILTACGGNKTADAPTTKAADTTTTAAAAEGETAAPAENGGAGLDLAVQIGPDPETVDPALNSAVDGGNMILHAFETLMSVDSENKIVPGQAESMEVSDDVVLSNNAIIIVASPLKNASLKSFGSISTGTETSRTLSYHSTFFT